MCGVEWGVGGAVSFSGKRAVPWQRCVVSLSIQDKPQTQHALWPTGKNRTKFAPFLKKWTQGPRLGSTLGLFPF